MNNYRLFIKDIFLDTVWEIVYFPIWWYSRGLKKAGFFCWQMLKNGWRALALSILLKSFFKPMFGQRGWDAYLLSFFARAWQLSWRFLLIGFWLLFGFLILLIWVGLIPFVIWQMI
ncbi:MAG: hypothetical protein ABIF84_01645 [Patescibacteria group bacterium]